MNKILKMTLQSVSSHLSNMAPNLVLVILTEFLIAKVTSSYPQSYSSSPYFIQDPRSSNCYTPDYQSYYASFASKLAQQTYQRPAEVLTPSPRPIEYKASYPKLAEFLSPGAQIPSAYPALTTSTIQSPVEYTSPIYQKAVEYVSPTVQTQRPVEYWMSPYQKPAEYVTPTLQPMEYRQPSYQPLTEYATSSMQPVKTPYTFQKPAEFFIPTIQAPIEFQSPFQKPTEFVMPTSQAPIEFQSPFQKPTEFVIPTIQAPIEFQSPFQKPTEFVMPTSQAPTEFQSLFQKPTEFVIPAIQAPIGFQSPFQKPTEFFMPTSQAPIEFQSPFQKPAEFVIPTIQAPTEFQSPTYQKTPELVLPTIQSISDYHQPVYQKVAEFIANQKPIEVQQSTCYTANNLTSKLQSSQVASSVLESLREFALSKSDSFPLKSSSGVLDTDVLNNLAIALQLLIVNNIINNPRSESVDAIYNLSNSIVAAYPAELSVSDPYYSQTPREMHNAKFLSSSNFMDDSRNSRSMLGLGSFGTGLPSPRPGFTLMSPYDAIASTPSSSPFSETTPSLFSLKNNFQSPYASMMAADNNRDLFSMTDLI